MELVCVELMCVELMCMCRACGAELMCTYVELLGSRPHIPVTHSQSVSWSATEEVVI